MQNSKNKNSFLPRTDLAIELREGLENETNDGIDVNEYDTDVAHITKVAVTTEKAAETLGKPIGNYITIESQLMKGNDIKTNDQLMRETAKNIQSLINLNDDSVVLVIGLGNWNVTPDALGPKVVSNVLVTRHIFETLPVELKGKVRSMSAIAPGVMGITGIETQEIIKGITQRIKPDLVIAVDALAARKTSRINATIQISDTGISPGSGMGNARKELSKKTLNVPVISIGIPTVVDAATLVNDTMDRILNEMIVAMPQGSHFYNALNSLQEDERYSVILDVLRPYEENMFVTPKEIDAVVDRLASILSNAIDVAVHKGISADEINELKF